MTTPQPLTLPASADWTAWLADRGEGELARARDVVIWSRRAEVAEAVNRDHANPEYLPGIELPACVRAVTDASEAVRGAGVVVVSSRAWQPTTPRRTVPSR